MSFRHSTLLALLLLAGCRQQNTDRENTVSGSAADSELTTTGEGLGAAQGAVEFEAPRLIPGVLAQLKLVQDSGGRLDEGTTAGYRSAAGALVDAMLTDLNRVGVGDDGSFRALGDSVVTLLGEGAGDAPKVDPHRLRQSAALLRRAIGTYQQRMREAQN